MELTDFAVRIGAALVFGALIGLERQWHHRLAGMRTHALVATGAAAFVALSGLAEGDNSGGRIAGQVVSGIGFLGAGVIFREGFNVRGLTTAATLWCAAAVGTLSGSSFLVAGAIVTAMVIATNVLLRPLSHLLDRRPPRSEMEVSYTMPLTCARTAEPQVRTLLLEAAAQHAALVRSIRSTSGSDPATVRLEPTLVIRGGGSELIEHIARQLGGHPSVTSVSWETAGEAHMD